MSPALTSITRAMEGTLSAIHSIESSDLNKVFDIAVSEINATIEAVALLNNDLGQTGAAAKEAASQTITAAQQATESIIQTEAAVQEAASQTIAVAKQTAEAIIQTREATQESSKAMTSLDYMATKALSTIIQMAKNAVKEIISLTDELTNVNSRLNLIAGTSESVAEIQENIFNAAQRSRGAYLDMANSVAQLRVNAADAFKSTEEAVFFTELLNKQFAISGTSASGVQSVLYNITQALSSGVLRGQDLNAVFANTPTIVQSIADYLDIPIGKVREMAAEGKITADIVKNAMFVAADDINSKFEEMPMTIGQIGTQISNNIIQTLQPAMQEVAEGAQYIYENWDKIDDIAIPVITGIATMLTVTLLPAILKTVASMLSLNGAVFAANAKFALLGIGISGIVMNFSKVGEEGKVLETVLFGVSVAFTVAGVAATVFKKKLDVATLGISVAIGAFVTFVTWLLKSKDATEEATDATAAAMAEMDQYRAMIEESMLAMEETRNATEEVSTALEGLATNAYTSAIQSQFLSRQFLNISKTSKINTNTIKELSSNYNYLNDLVPNLAENLGKQNAKIVELFENAYTMTDAALDNAAAWLDESDALSILANDIANVTAAYYEFAKAAAFVQAYQGKMQETATKIIEAEMEVRARELQQEDITSKAFEESTSFQQGLARALIQTAGVEYRVLESEINELNDVISAADEEMLSYFEGMQKYMGSMLENQEAFTTDGGKSVRTKGEVKIDAEDIRLLLDISTRGYADVTYQTLTPQISLHIGTVRETADIDEIMDAVVERIEEAADASLTLG